MAGEPTEVYLAVVHAAAGVGGDPDVAALVLADLAGLHLRLGYRADGVRPLELATTGEQVSVPVRRVLAAVSAQVAAEASDVSSSDHDGSSCDEHGQ